MSGVEEVPLVAVAGLVVVLAAAWLWATQGAPAAEKFVRDVGQRIHDAFPDEEPTAAEPCPPAPDEPPSEGPKPELPPGGAPEPDPKPPPWIPPIFSSTHKPVIPGQQYTDQTCSNERLGQLRDQLSKNKEAAGGSGLPFKPPKRPYDESDPAQAAKKKLLCDDLRERERAWQDLIKTRDQIQDECFNSPKTTEDEKKRDDDHKRARKEADQALENIRKDIAFYGCP
jgi:hypothetical protein